MARKYYEDCRGRIHIIGKVEQGRELEKRIQEKIPKTTREAIKATLEFSTYREFIRDFFQNRNMNKPIPGEVYCWYSYIVKIHQKYPAVQEFNAIVKAYKHLLDKYKYRKSKP